MRAAHNLTADDREAVCRILKIGKVGASSGLADYIKECPSPDSVHLLMLMQAASGPHDWSYGDNCKQIHNEALMLVAGNVFGAQLKVVIAEIQGEVKAELWPKPAKPAKAEKDDLPHAPLAQPKNAGGKDSKGPRGK